MEYAPVGARLTPALGLFATKLIVVPALLRPGPPAAAPAFLASPAGAVADMETGPEGPRLREFGGLLTDGSGDATPLPLPCPVVAVTEGTTADVLIEVERWPDTAGDEIETILEL